MRAANMFFLPSNTADGVNTSGATSACSFFTSNMLSRDGKEDGVMANSNRVFSLRNSRQSKSQLTHYKQSCRISRIQV